jgi:uncharacterized membrane protein
MSSIYKLFNNNYITTLLSSIILIYSANLGNKIPKFYTKVVDHYAFKILFLIILLYVLNNNKNLGFVIAIAYIIINQTITNNMVTNNMNQFENLIEFEHFTNNI